MRIRLAGLLVLVAALLAACGSGGSSSSTTGSSSGTSTSSGTTTTSSGATTSTAGGATTSARAYFLRDERVGPVRRAVASPQVAHGALDALVAGPTAAEAAMGFSSALPAGTKVNEVTIDGGVATADLSPEFTSGGGSLSMQARVAQVVFTLTQFPTVQSVRFAVDGQPLTVLGGEGVVLDHPQTRADWEALSPAILVESPLPGDAVTSPLRLTGTSNTFEATYRFQLLDPAGVVLHDGFGTATSGTGTRGTFDDSFEFTTATHGTATLVVFEESAKDGSQINVVRIPLEV